MYPEKTSSTLVFKLLITVSLCCILSAGATADTIYVDDDGPIYGNGTSWQMAFPDLQEALLTALPGDEIWVAEGLYIPLLPGDPYSTFELKDEISLYGGFAGDEETVEERDVEANPTVLSGDLLGNDGPNFQNNEENCLHVVTAGGYVDNWAILDGFTVTAGCADSNPSGSSNDRCAGVMVNGGIGVIVRNCTIKENWGHVGAGIGYINDSSGSVIDCKITDNFANYLGGGLTLHRSSVEVVGCSIKYNTAFYECAGGVSVTEAGDMIFKNCEIAKNIAMAFTGDYGGGMHVDLGANVTLIESTFAQNTANDDGGGLSIANGSRATVINCRFLGNQADNGAGVYVEGPGALTATTLVNCVFSGNYAYYDGGGLHVQDGGDVVLTNSTFSMNTGQDDGGGLCILSGCAADITNCILWGNTDDGGADESAQVHNEGSLFIYHSCVEGWTGAMGGSNNMGEDPLFKDADGGDNVSGTLDDDLQLKNASPCIDQGDTDALPSDEYDLDDDGDLIEKIPFDLNCCKRVRHQDVDMGALEKKRLYKESWRDPSSPPASPSHPNGNNLAK